MSKIQDFIRRIKAIFNKNPRLEAANKLEEDISLKSDDTSFKEDLKKIYSKQDVINKIIEQLKIDEKLINNKKAFLEITSTVKDILDERDDIWSKAENSISNEQLQHMISIIKKSEINPEKTNYKPGKTKGLNVNKDGNVTIQKMTIYKENEKILADDEFTSETLSINENGTLHKEGFAVKIDKTTVNTINEENATRKFSMDYDENGELQKIITKNFKIIDGKNVLINEKHEEGENLLTLNDISQREKIFKYIDKTGKEGIDDLFQKNHNFLNSLKGVVREQIIDKMLDYDFSYIKYDTSNNPDLYKKTIKKFISEISQSELYKDYEETKQWQISCIKPILEEIENPKKVEDGMYKIPQKYLFEAIRMGAELYQKETDENLKLNNFMTASQAIGKYTNDNMQSYLHMDGKLTIEQGKKMEELYEDKNNYILQHKYGIMSEPNKKAECFKNGKKSSTYDNELQKNRLECTTTGTYNHTMSFSEFITNDCNKIVICIPREAFKPNSDIPVWGANEQNGDSFILPEYVIGNYGPEGFEENPIPLEERTHYLLKYKDNSAIPMEDYHNIDEEKDK